MNKLRKIDAIMFFVENLEKAARFYEEGFGLKRVWTDEAHGQIGLMFPESDAEVVIHNDSTMPSPEFSFLVDDVE